MKKLNLLLTVILITTTLVNCSSDDDSNDSNETTTIIGKWKIASIELNNEVFNLDECHLQQTHTYLQNGDFIEYAPEDEVFPCAFSTEIVQYTLENGVLTIINENEGIDGNPFKVINEIMTLNESTLIFKEISEGGEILSNNQQQIFTFIRLVE